MKYLYATLATFFLYWTVRASINYELSPNLNKKWELIVASGIVLTLALLTVVFTSAI